MLDYIIVYLFAYLSCFRGDDDLQFSDNHRFIFQNSFDESKMDFEKKVLQNPVFGDSFYFLLGHPRNEEANKLHLKSYYALSKRLNQASLPAKASSINKDLSVAQQHHEHVSESYWTSDEWLIDYGQEEMGLDIEEPVEQNSHDFDFLGIIVHSWDDCIDSGDSELNACVHVVQIRNYGQYFPKNVTKSHLEPVFNWINADIEKNAETPIIIVFQEFDTDHRWLAKSAFRRFLEDDKKAHSQNLLAVVFSLMSKNVTLDNSLCYGRGRNGGSFAAPLLSFGQLPERSYISVKFNPASKGAKNIYQMDVQNDTHTTVTEVKMDSDKKCLKG